jgi:hypothetical protein
MRRGGRAFTCRVGLAGAEQTRTLMLDVAASINTFIDEGPL